MKIKITFKRVHRDSRIVKVHNIDYKGIAYSFDKKYCKKLDEIVEKELREMTTKGCFYIESIKTYYE